MKTEQNVSGRRGSIVGVRSWLALGAAAVVALAIGCGVAIPGNTEVRDESLSVGNAPRLVVNSTNGKITVNAGESGFIHVSASIRKPDRLDYQLMQNGDTVTILAESRQSRFDFSDSPGADLVISAPLDTLLDLRTSNGRIEVREIQKSGRIRTSNGRIVLDGVKGEFEARTSNGSIEFTGEMPAGSNNELRTSNGNVIVNLIGDPNVSIDASTSNGQVSSSKPITATRTDSSHLTGTIGAGEADLIVRTSNGSVTIQ